MAGLKQHTAAREAAPIAADDAQRRLDLLHAVLDLLPVGAPRRDWRAAIISDGMVIVRHPELSKTIEMTERFAGELRLHAG